VAKPRTITKIAIGAAVVVLGPVFTVVDVLGGITVLAAEADLHGVIPAMRIAIVACVLVVVVPLGWWVGAKLLGRINAHEHRGESAARAQSSSPARHRKVA
jgi:hypothetical protein